MMQNYFEKLAIDHQLDIEVISADPHQYFEQKVDFIIVSRAHHRGVDVNVEKPGRKIAVGVQLTIGKKIDHKAEQIKRAKTLLPGREDIDDIVLIKVDPQFLFQAFPDWKTRKVSPGGPDRNWSKPLKRKIFWHGMAGILSLEEMQGVWMKVDPSWGEEELDLESYALFPEELLGRLHQDANAPIRERLPQLIGGGPPFSETQRRALKALDIYVSGLFAHEQDKAWLIGIKRYLRPIFKNQTKKSLPPVSDGR